MEDLQEYLIKKFSGIMQLHLEYCLLLTRIGVPVSTTFLVLSAFASTVILEKMLIKSVVGYGLAAVTGYICWIAISKFINEKFDEIKDTMENKLLA